MKISEILKRKKLFGNDIRQRFKNNQIKINGETTQNIDLDIELDDEDEPIIIDGGDFIFNLLKINSLFGMQLIFLDFETLSNSNVNNELKSYLDDFFIIRYSKKDIIVVKKIK